MVQRHQRTTGIANRDHVAIEQNTIVDDNLLPSAEELEKLKQVDPSIVPWIMQRAEKEQDTRLQFNRDQMRLAYKESGMTHCALWFAFVLAIVVLFLSSLFIYLGKELAGTIFGGVGILILIQSFLKFGRK
ncbi:MAG: hypothetical protein LBJ72_11475 [Dysgonamonadaceae bacterium]|jgi:uncharacterized membrane protein|nr:hypothetical protein [Dysgonamonadaceae bacterium]